MSGIVRAIKAERIPGKLDPVEREVADVEIAIGRWGSAVAVVQEGDGNGVGARGRGHMKCEVLALPEPVLCADREWPGDDGAIQRNREQRVAQVGISREVEFQHVAKAGRAAGGDQAVIAVATIERVVQPGANQRVVERRARKDGAIRVVGQGHRRQGRGPATHHVVRRQRGGGDAVQQRHGKPVAVAMAGHLDQRVARAVIGQAQEALGEGVAAGVAEAVQRLQQRRQIQHVATLADREVSDVVGRAELQPAIQVGQLERVLPGAAGEGIVATGIPGVADFQEQVVAGTSIGGGPTKGIQRVVAVAAVQLAASAGNEEVIPGTAQLRLSATAAVARVQAVVAVATHQQRAGQGRDQRIVAGAAIHAGPTEGRDQAVTALAAERLPAAQQRVVAGAAIQRRPT